MVAGDCVKEGEEVSPLNHKGYPEASAVDKDCPVEDLRIPPVLVREDRGDFTFITPEVMSLDPQGTVENSVGQSAAKRIVKRKAQRLQCNKHPKRSRWLLMTFIWVLLIGYTIHFGVLIWVTLEITNMPNTFARRELLLPFGSLNRYPSLTAAPPLFPIFQMLINFIMIASTTMALVIKSKSSVTLVKLCVRIQFIFSLPVIPLSCIVWMFRKSKLHEKMFDAMSRFSMSTHTRFYLSKLLWDETQTVRRCCGMDGPNDWHGISRIPNSCNVEEFTTAAWQHWTVGCYEKEYETLSTYGFILLICLILGLFFSGMMLCLLICRHELILHDGKTQSSKPSQKFEFRKGSSFMSLNLNDKKTTVHLQGASLESNGVLASNLSVLENEATIHISNFKASCDSVKMERENERILLSVCRNKKPRGICIVTTSDETQLKEVKVEDTKNGALRVSIPPSLI